MICHNCQHEMKEHIYGVGCTHVDILAPCECMNSDPAAELARVKAERDEAVELLEEILQKKIAAFLAKAKP